MLFLSNSNLLHIIYIVCLFYLLQDKTIVSVVIDSDDMLGQYDHAKKLKVGMVQKRYMTRRTTTNEDTNHDQYKIEEGI